MVKVTFYKFTIIDHRNTFLNNIEFLEAPELLSTLRKSVDLLLSKFSRFFYFETVIEPWF